MARRFYPQQREVGKKLRINDQIRISPVRLIDDHNEQVGIVELDEAKRRARETGLDLVEVSGTSKPPVCRIMDYGKWKYQQKKKEQKARSHSKHSELKEVRLRPKIDDHDLLIKTEKAKQFLTEGHKVQFTMQFRGREMAHRELGLKTLRQISDTLAPLSKIEIMPRMAAGRRMTMVLAPDRSGKTSSTKRTTVSKVAPEASGVGGAGRRELGRTPATAATPSAASAESASTMTSPSDSP